MTDDQVIQSMPRCIAIGPLAMNAAVCCAIIILLMAAAHATGSSAAVAAAATPVTGGKLLTVAEFPDGWKQNWPIFRGPGGSGVASGAFPTSWDGKSGKGILWTTTLPLPGKNSPIVWGDRLFLSGADKTQRAVYCVNTSSGRLLWTGVVSTAAGANAGPPAVLPDTGYAAATMATDGQRVFAIFANGDVACFDFNGTALWMRNLGMPKNTYGLASSLTIYPGALIVQFDQSSGNDGISALLALDVVTGKTIWQTRRDLPNSWSTPILINTGKTPEIITTANPWVMAYNPLAGEELWRVRCLRGDVAPSPIYAGNLVFVCNQYAFLAAIQPDGHGDVSKTKMRWTAEDGLPDIVSPLSDGTRVYLVTSDGTMTAYDAASGTKIWEQSLDTEFRSSPTLVGKLIYLMDAHGVMHLLEAGETYHEIGTAALGEDAESTPAFAHARIYIRGVGHLYCIGAQ